MENKLNEVINFRYCLFSIVVVKLYLDMSIVGTIYVVLKNALKPEMTHSN